MTKTTTISAKDHGTLRGELTVPGDKSISHRAVMLGAVADGVTEIPTGDTVLDAGSHVGLIVRSGDAELLAKICGK